MLIECYPVIFTRSIPIRPPAEPVTDAEPTARQRMIAVRGDPPLLELADPVRDRRPPPGGRPGRRRYRATSSSPPFVFTLLLADSIVLIALMVALTRAHGESPAAMWLGVRPPAREFALGLALVPLVFLMVGLVMNGLLRAAARPAQRARPIRSSSSRPADRRTPRCSASLRFSRAASAKSCSARFCCGASSSTSAVPTLGVHRPQHRVRTRTLPARLGRGDRDRPARRVLGDRLPAAAQQHRPDREPRRVQFARSAARRAHRLVGHTRRPRPRLRRDEHDVRARAQILQPLRHCRRQPLGGHALPRVGGRLLEGHRRAVARELVAMLLEVLARFVLADLCRDDQSAGRDTSGCAACRAPAPGLAPRPARWPASPRRASRPTRAFIAVSCCSTAAAGRFGGRKSRHFPQLELTLDRLANRRRIGRRLRLDEPELHERLHIGLRDRFGPDPRQHAVEELLLCSRCNHLGHEARAGQVPRDRLGRVTHTPQNACVSRMCTIRRLSREPGTNSCGLRLMPRSTRTRPIRGDLKTTPNPVAGRRSVKSRSLASGKTLPASRKPTP